MIVNCNGLSMAWFRKIQGQQWELKPGQDQLLGEEQVLQTETNYYDYNVARSQDAFFVKLQKTLQSYREHCIRKCPTNDDLPCQEMRQDELALAALFAEQATNIRTSRAQAPPDIAYCMYHSTLLIVIRSLSSESVTSILQ